MINLPEHLESIERHYIKQALIMACGVVAHAADLLSLNRSTLTEKMRKHDITWQAILAGELLEGNSKPQQSDVGTEVEAAKVEMRGEMIKQVMKFCDILAQISKEKLGNSISS